MAATTAVPGGAASDSVQLATLPPASGRAGLAGAFRSELTKIRSVRSTYWTLFALLLVSIGIGAAISAATKAQWSHMPPASKIGFDPTQLSLGGMFELGQLVIVVLGSLVITAEYSTGMVRTSLTAQPRRLTVYAAKALVFALVALVVTMVSAFIAFFLGQALMHGTGEAATISQPNVLRAIVGSSLYVSLCGLFAFALGSMLRHTAGTITTVIGLLFVIPILLHLLPDNWFFDVERWFPDAAGRAMSATVGPFDPHLFAPWTQLLVFAVYTLVFLVAGGLLFRSRDA